MFLQINIFDQSNCEGFSDPGTDIIGYKQRKVKGIAFWEAPQDSIKCPIDTVSDCTYV